MEGANDKSSKWEQIAGLSLSGTAYLMDMNEKQQVMLLEGELTANLVSKQSTLSH